MNTQNPKYDCPIPAPKPPKTDLSRLKKIESCAKTYLHEQDHGSSHGAEREARKALKEALESKE